MKFIVPVLLSALCFLSGCPEPCGPDPRVNEYKLKVQELSAEVKLLDEFGKKFQDEYEGLATKLDNINRVKDSLSTIQGGEYTFDADLVNKMEAELEEAKETISSLRDRLEEENSGNAILGALRMQLNEAENRIVYLEEVNTRLLAENDSIKIRMDRTHEAFMLAKSEAVEAEQKLEQAMAEMEKIEAEAEIDLNNQLDEVKSQAAEERKRYIKAADFYKKAMDGFVTLEEFIDVRNNGNFRIKKKGMKRSEALSQAKAIARKIYEHLTEASKLGHSESERKIQKLQHDPKYELIAPY